jgi:large subunit ribosomal protein L24
MSGSPHSPRRQRRALYEASTFERRRRMTVLLSRELRARFHRRSVPLRKGDTVRVLGGSYKGREERVAKIDRRGYAVTLDNVTLKTADEKMKPLGLRPGHLVITRLNLSDSWRRRSLRIRDEDVTAEERGEKATEEESEEGTAAIPETTEKAEETPAPVPASGSDDVEEDEGGTEPETKPASRARKKGASTTSEEEDA